MSTRKNDWLALLFVSLARRISGKAFGGEKEIIA